MCYTLCLYSRLDDIFTVVLASIIVYKTLEGEREKASVPNGNTEAQVTTPAIPPQSRIVIHSGFSPSTFSEIKALLLNS